MHADVSFAAAFLAGLVSFLSPCVLPLVPGLFPCSPASAWSSSARASSRAADFLLRRFRLSSASQWFSFRLELPPARSDRSCGKIAQPLRQLLALLSFCLDCICLAG